MNWYNSIYLEKFNDDTPKYAPHRDQQPPQKNQSQVQKLQSH